MNVIKTIKITADLSLFSVVSAMDEIILLRKTAEDSGCEEPKPIKMAMESIIQVLSYKFHTMFRDEFPEYANNQMALRGNSKGNFIDISDEKLENMPDDCDDGDDDGEFSDLLKNAGLETSDDHVDRLADDLRNKRGGQA